MAYSRIVSQSNCTAYSVVMIGFLATAEATEIQMDNRLIEGFDDDYSPVVATEPMLPSKAARLKCFAPFWQTSLCTACIGEPMCYGMQTANTELVVTPCMSSQITKLQILPLRPSI